MAAETDGAGRLFAKAPAIRSLIEMAQHLADAKAALDLELAVEVAIGCRDCLLRNVCSQDFDRPALPQLGLLGELDRSEEHTSELQSLMRISYAVFCLKKKKT